VFPWIGCGQCRDCLAGDENLCVKQRFLGVSIDGGFASHVLVPDAKYLLDYGSMPVNQAATLMCSGVTAYGVVDFAGNEKSMAFAVSVLARGGKVVVSGLMGGNFSLPMVQWVYKRMTIEGFMVGTLAEGHELMALARAGKIKPTPMREEPMADVQKWIDALRAGQVVGRVILKN
jgi:D-arabinose 1-dehydrogenase-like Zn-dependent alcohol dehydrogenase